MNELQTADETSTQIVQAEVARQCVEFQQRAIDEFPVPRVYSIDEAERLVEHNAWKRRQAIELPQPRKLEPTLVHKLHRMNPAERVEVRAILNALTLRKTIRAVLREAQMMQRLSGIAQAHASSQRFARKSTEREREAALAFFNQEQQRERRPEQTA